MSNPAPIPAGPSPEHDAGLLGYASGRSFPPGAGRMMEAYRAGPLLIARNGSTLPARCVLCGEEGHEGPIRLTFTWDSSFRRTAVSTLELRRQAVVFGYLCGAHRRRWRQARLVGGAGTVAGGLVLVAGITIGVVSECSDVPSYTPLGIGLTLAGFAVIIGFLFFFTLRSRTLACSRIEQEYVYLEGAAEGFLRDLAEPPAPAGH